MSESPPSINLVEDDAIFAGTTLVEPEATPAPSIRGGPIGPLAEGERHHVFATIEGFGSNQTRAAQTPWISLSTLERKLTSGGFAGRTPDPARPGAASTQRILNGRFSAAGPVHAGATARDAVGEAAARELLRNSQGPCRCCTTS